MEKNNMEGARIYAESAIRESNQALNYLRLSSRIEAVAQRVDTAIKMNMMTKTMQGIVGSMDSVMQSMDVEKITAVMDKFERQFEDMDLTSKCMENSMQQSTAMSMPENQVENLMHQVADEHGLEFQSQLQPAGQGKVKDTVDSKSNTNKNVLNVGANGGGVNGGKNNNNNDQNNKGAGGAGAAGGAGGNSSSSSGGGGGGGGGGGMALGGGSGGGSAAPVAGPSSKEEDDLEARLRRLQGL